jgi:5-methylcytosine-specific restriction endonuclease McrA
VDAPFCACGCGQAVTRIKKTDRARGRVKGEWNRYARCHGPRPWALDPIEREARDSARSKRWYEANREMVRAKQKAYREANRDLELMHSRHSGALRRARLRGADVVLSLVVLERDDGTCGICGGDVDPTDFHVDHVEPLALGGEHSYANVQAAHPDCNRRKGWAA